MANTAHITENQVEFMAIQLLEKLGYKYFNGSDIAPDSNSIPDTAIEKRNSYYECILPGILAESVKRINKGVPSSAIDDAIKEINRISSDDKIADNQAFHRLLTEGINVTYGQNGIQRGNLVWLIDFNNIANNTFTVVNQFTIADREHNATRDVNKRPDLILFVNGIPLVVIELKNPVDENATLLAAYKQINTYKEMIPSLFTYNGFIVLSDGLEAKAGTITAGYSRFMSWKTSDGKTLAHHTTSELETLIKGMLTPATLIDLIRHFIVFESQSKEDKETKVRTITSAKKIAAYHQYYAVNSAVQSALRASGLDFSQSATHESPEKYGLKGVKAQQRGDRKGGVVWHTQGSGKSLSMVFFAGKIVLSMNNPTILVITDRNDLDDQLFDTFASAKQLLRQEPIQAQSIEHLKQLLQVASGGIVFSTIHKFQPSEGNVYDCLTKRENVIVIADEAHRTQYGLTAKAIDDKDDEGKVIGQKIAYGFAKYMRDALPNATYLGFTGTPIESNDVNTPGLFGNYIDIYDISQAVADGATVRIYYESRLAKIDLPDAGKKLINDLEEELSTENLDDSQRAKAKWTQLEALIGSKNRITKIAEDIVNHFTFRQKVLDGKGMIVSMSRRIATDLYSEIIKLRPEWHNADLRKGAIKVVMTAASSDGPDIAKHHTTKEERKILADRMKDDDDELKLVIVRDMWLTGFDVPSLHTLYIDKPMKGHNLMQAIARVNRVYKDKSGGLIVDYLGFASDLKEALAFYSDSGGKGDVTATQEQAVKIMLEKLEIVEDMYHNFDYKVYFAADTATKLSTILKAEDYILNLPDGKKRYLANVTALSSAFAIAIPHEEAIKINEKMAFFQAVKARLSKFDTPTGGKTNEEIETAIRQVIDKALVTDKVVDIFEAAGIKKPDISILSDEFMLEVKNMEHKNIALEVLKRLLNDEIKGRMKVNLIQSKSLLDMLNESIRKYTNKVLSAAEVIDELIKLSKEITEMDKKPKEMGLSVAEYAFYTALANNKSALEVMQQDKLRELAVEVFNSVRKNATIDWTLKASAKANLKASVKRVLNRYGYPPDMQLLAIDTVLRQAELLANEIAMTEK